MQMVDVPLAVVACLLVLEVACWKGLDPHCQFGAGEQTHVELDLPLPAGLSSRDRSFCGGGSVKLLQNTLKRSID